LLGTTVGGFRVTTRLAEGGMGAVYRCEHPTLKKWIVLKVIRPDHASKPHVSDRFLAEARLLSEIEHPNIVGVHDFGSFADGTLYLTMEYLEGETLGAYLKRVGRLSAEETVRILGGVCDGLEAAHAVRIIHRDIKPDNLYLARLRGSKTGDLIAKVLDFGIAKDRGREEAGQLQETAEGVLLGTPQYMSPEQALGHSNKIDPRSDVYSLGAVAYQCLTGKPPFVAGGLGEYAVAHAEWTPEPIRKSAPEIPEAFETVVVGRALAKSQACRFQTMAQFKEALELALRPDAQAQATLAALLATLPPLPDDRQTLAEGPGRPTAPESPRALNGSTTLSYGATSTQGGQAPSRRRSLAIALALSTAVLTAFLLVGLVGGKKQPGSIPPEPQINTPSPSEPPNAAAMATPTPGAVPSSVATPLAGTMVAPSSAPAPMSASPANAKPSPGLASGAPSNNCGCRVERSAATNSATAIDAGRGSSPDHHSADRRQLRETRCGGTAASQAQEGGQAVDLLQLGHPLPPMMKRYLSIALGVLSLLALQAPVRGDASASQQASDKAAQCQRYYNVGDYKHALVACKAAYLADPQPSYLYALAQIYRFSGDHGDAAHYYALYLGAAEDSLSPEEKAQAEKLRDSEQAAAELKTAPPQGISPPPKTGAPASAPSAQPNLPPPTQTNVDGTTGPTSEHWYQDWVLDASLGVAAIGFGTSAALYATSEGKNDAAKTERTLAAFDSDVSTAHNERSLGSVFLLVGGAGLVGAVVDEAIRAPHSSASSDHVAAAIGPGTAILSLSGAF
jgi:serine/threonine-protein kinase